MPRAEPPNPAEPQLRGTDRQTSLFVHPPQEAPAASSPAGEQPRPAPPARLPGRGGGSAAEAPAAASAPAQTKGCALPQRRSSPSPGEKRRCQPAPRRSLGEGSRERGQQGGHGSVRRPRLSVQRPLLLRRRPPPLVPSRHPHGRRTPRTGTPPAPGTPVPRREHGAPRPLPLTRLHASAANRRGAWKL